MRFSVARLARRLHAIGLENGHGGHQLGCEEAIATIKGSKMLQNSRVPVHWREVIPETVTGRGISQIEGVIQNSKKLCAAVQQAIIEDIGSGDREELLVVGGDHSCAIGTWSGVASRLRPYGDIGLVWVDAHLDAHTPNTSPSGNLHGQPVAHLLGFGNDELSRIGDAFPKIKPENLVFVGIRSYEPEEREFLHKLGVRIFYDDEVQKRGISDVMSEAVDRVSHKTYGFGLSIDMDGFRVEDAPAVGTPASGGIIADEFLKFMTTHAMDKLLVTELVEFLPKYDDVNRTSEKLVTDLVEHIYLPRFARYDIAEELDQRRRKQAYA
uniref:Arginase n=1 Tax=Panagrellus redivivus TaxID=6233 RepID=A0A7E4VJ78_PANRE